MRKKISTLAVTFSLMTGVASLAQEKENVIMTAMKDELKRSMDIRETGYDKPFFISYSITDLTNYTAYASLGGIIQSGETRNRAKGVRVLVGNYEFNDESLDNNTQSEPSSREIQLPQDDDYFGIRRALWTTTDVVYKGAAQKYRKHQNTIKEQNKKLSELPHRTFAKTPVTIYNKQRQPYTFDQKKVDEYCRKISAVFINYPELESSDAMISVSQGTYYFVNSEGTMVVRPYHMAVLQCRAQLKTDMGEPLEENFTHYALTWENLPPVDSLIKQAESICVKLRSQQKAIALEEEYTGPVLLLGSSVADVFASTLFSFRESLVASNAIMSTTDLRPEAPGSMDARIGKSIIDNTITVKAVPKQNKYGAIDLLGSYDVDDEGVVPPDELILVEKGILKNLLNDRSLTREGQTPNGHATGPAVIDVSSSKTASIAALKASLIEAARNAGLEFALVVKENGGVTERMAEIWKVDLETGSESLMRSAQLGNLSLKDLRKIRGISAGRQVRSLPAGDGNLASFIVPEAMLLENVDVVPLKLPYLEKEEEFVSSPLKK